MTLSWPSFSAAAIRALMPPPAAAEVSVAQLALLVLLVEVVLLLLLELEEHAAVTSRLAATAAVAEIACLARKVPSQTTVPVDQYAGAWLDKSRSWLAKTNGR